MSESKAVVELAANDLTGAGVDDGMRERDEFNFSVGIQFGGVPIARDADPMPIERDDKPALGVILRFPDKQAVRDFFDSAEYAPLRTFRHSFCTASALVIED